MFAVVNKHPAVVKLLIDKGADENAVSKDNRTALSFVADASTNRAEEIKKILYRQGQNRVAESLQIQKEYYNPQQDRPRKWPGPAQNSILAVFKLLR